jgi:hypothetical protein
MWSLTRYYTGQKKLLISSGETLVQGIIFKD